MPIVAAWEFLSLWCTFCKLLMSARAYRDVCMQPKIYDCADRNVSTALVWNKAKADTQWSINRTSCVHCPFWSVSVFKTKINLISSSDFRWTKRKQNSRGKIDRSSGTYCDWPALIRPGLISRHYVAKLPAPSISHRRANLTVWCGHSETVPLSESHRFYPKNLHFACTVPNVNNSR